MRLRLLAAVVTASALAASIGGGVAASSATAAPPPLINALTTEGVEGSYLLGSNQLKSYTDAAVSIGASSGSLDFDALSGSWTAQLEKPTDQPLSVGTFPLGRAAGVGQVGLDIFGDGRGCNGYTGTIEIEQVARDSGSVITAFAGTYSTSCDGGPANVGELRYNSTVGYVRLGAGPLGVTGPSHAVTVTASATTTYGAATLDGLDAGSYALAADTCAGKTLTVGQTCSVAVASHRLHTAGLAGTVTIPADTGDQVVGLTAVGVDTPSGGYAALPPTRVLDTRKHFGVPTTTPLTGGHEIEVPILNTPGVPGRGVSAVVLNVTAILPTTAGYVTVYPSGVVRPSASSVNFGGGTTVADLVTVPVGANGRVRLFNFSGSVHLAADVVGYYNSASRVPDANTTPWNDFYSSQPQPYRALDTRRAIDGASPVQSGHYYWTAVDYGSYNDKIRAFALNVTVVSPTGSGYVTAYDGDSGNWPNASTLNFTAGRTVANMSIVKAGSCFSDCGSSTRIPRFAIANSSTGSVHVVVDVVGLYYQGEEGARGWRYASLPSPSRFVDSRRALGLPTALAPARSVAVVAPTYVAGYNTMAVVSNLTAAAPSAATVLTLWRNDGSGIPRASNLNPYAHQLVSNMAITEVWTHNDFRVYNLAGSTPLVMDAAGTMELYPARIPTTGLAKAGAAAAKGAGSHALPAPRRAAGHSGSAG